MKVAIILGRGIEGCGVTRYALEEQKWYKNNSIECTIYASCDKKWGRKDAQENDIIEFTNSEIKALSQKLNSEYDIVYYQSLPSKKGHSEEYQKLFYDYLVCEVHKPLKISHQNDHKLQSLSRNYNIWEIMSHMDGSFTHSLSSPFAKKMKELNPHVPIMKMGLGFDFDSLRKYWKPINQQIRRVSYFGRFAGFKDPKRIIELQPQLKEVNIISELRGIERSIGSLDLFYDDLTDRDNSYKKNIYEVKNNEVIDQTCEKAYIYGPYNRLEGIEELSYSMFGADFYNLEANAYGDNMEFAMCEIIASGSIALFDYHWAENCKHVNGTKFLDIKNFAIYSDKNNFEATIDEMFELANNNELRNNRRESSFEIAKQHCDNNIVYADMHNKAINCKKTQKVQSTLF